MGCSRQRTAASRGQGTHVIRQYLNSSSWANSDPSVVGVRQLQPSQLAQSFGRLGRCAITVLERSSPSKTRRPNWAVRELKAPSHASAAVEGPVSALLKCPTAALRLS